MDLDLRHFGNTKSYKLKLQPYKQMPRSNTEFLNLFGSGDTPKAKALKEDYYKRIDALPASDKAGKDALFAELESKLAALNAPKSDMDDVQKAKDKAQRGEKVSGILAKGLDIFTKTTEALGMGKPVGNEMQNRSQGVDLVQRQDDRQVPIAVWIIGGVVVLGLGIFAIYKFRK